MARGEQLTPMLRHYLEVKAQHPDAILFYRMGDFYEMFFDDAVEAAPVLEIALTARQKGSPSEAPMCGVPHHALDNYLGKLIRAGFKVAICDQMEDPAAAKGLVRREVTRVVTPGTLSDPDLLEGKEENLLCAVSWQNGEGAGAFLDVSTGRLLVHRWPSTTEAIEALALRQPRELVFDEGELPSEIESWLEMAGVCRSPASTADRLTAERARGVLSSQFRGTSLRGFGLRQNEPATLATAAALRYAHDTQKSDLTHIRELKVHEQRDYMVVDDTTLQNLEVLRGTRDGRQRGTLLSLLDCTRTAMGARLLRSWLQMPLLARPEILARHDAVEELVDGPALRERVRAGLEKVSDLERLLSRAVLGRLTPREAAALRDSLAEIATLWEAIAACRSDLLAAMATVERCAELGDLLCARLAPEPPAQLRSGGVVAEGVNGDLDHARSLVRDSKQHILALETEERERSGISSLKVGFNKVFGYYLEVTKANQARVPEHYTRKQTLTNAERYITPEIKELEEQILGAEDRLATLEEEEYRQIVEAIVAEADGLTPLARAVASLDVLAAFAETAARRAYVRPRMGEPGGAIGIDEGRHPVVEAMLRDEFIPNDLALDGDEAQVILLTGPNMGGKSTYLRQVALIVLLAQAGSFVPARRAEIGIVDRIFTRVGASDDLTRGESTFMVEMIETANILRYAGQQSLVILDEVGRGTATFDGLSLAWAIVEHLHETSRPKTLFATHYHELTELASLLPRVVNRTMAVKEWEEQIVFLRRVVPGSADKSYGIQVARLAGLPPPVLERASEILANLERQEYDLAGRPRLAEGPHAPASVGPDQLSLFRAPEELVASILRDVDVDRLSPLAALNLLHTLKSRLEDTTT
jgi:DNA mismatch repair protein MutS